MGFSIGALMLIALFGGMVGGLCLGAAVFFLTVNGDGNLWKQRRSKRRRRVSAAPVTEPPVEPPVESAEAAISLRESGILENLRNFSKVDIESQGDEVVCPICLDELDAEHGDEIFASKNCNHTFHLECLAKWVHCQQLASCPICKKETFPVQEFQGRSSAV